MVPVLSDGVVLLNGHSDADAADHLAGEDEETTRRFGWWPATSTEDGVRLAFRRWSDSWESGGPTRAFAARDAVTGRLVGGYELRLQADGSAHVSCRASAGARRRGYATRALVLHLTYGASIGVTRFEAQVAADNMASCRVSEYAGFPAVGAFTDSDGTATVRTSDQGDGPFAGRPSRRRCRAIGAGS